MHDVLVLEAAHHVRHGVCVPDVAQERVALALTLRRAADEPCDIDELDRRRNHLFRLVQLHQLVETGIRDRDNADVRVDGAKRVIRRFRLLVGEGVEEGRLTDVRQADDANGQSHGPSLARGRPGGHSGNPESPDREEDRCQDGGKRHRDEPARHDSAHDPHVDRADAPSETDTDYGPDQGVRRAHG